MLANVVLFADEGQQEERTRSLRDAAVANIGKQA